MENRWNIIKLCVIFKIISNDYKSLQSLQMLQSQTISVNVYKSMKHIQNFTKALKYVEILTKLVNRLKY